MRTLVMGSCVVVLLAAVTAPSTAQTNLLLNEGFDVIAGSNNPSYPNGPVNARIWLGDYTIMGCPDPGTGCSQGWGSRSWWIAPVSPVQTWEMATGAGGSDTSQTYQTVAVSNPSTVSFTGYVQTGPTGNGEVNNITINVYDNSEPTGTPIAAVTIDQTLAYPGWYVVPAMGGASTSGYVTVEFTTNTSAPHGYAGAVHCEDFSMTSSVGCTTQHTLDPIAPPIQANHDADPTLTITGTDLERVTGAKLLQVESETIVEATAITVGSGPGEISMDVTFPIGTDGAPLGLYTVMTEQASASENCVTQTVVDGVEVVCANPSSFTSMVPDELRKPQGQVQFTINGANLDELDGVSLVLGTQPPIAGTIDDNSNPSAILVTFDLAGKLSGHYGLAGTRPDACDDPPPKPDVFTLLPAEDLPNLLENPGFETGDTSGWTVSDVIDIHGPGYYWGAGPNTGNYGACVPDNGGLSTAQASQTIDVNQHPSLCGPREYDLTLSFWGQITNGHLTEAFFETYVEGRLLVDGYEQASVRYSSIDPNVVVETNAPHGQVVVVWSGMVTSTIELEVFWRADGGSYYIYPQPHWGVVTADDFELTAGGCALCPHDPAFDFDDDGDVDQADFGVMQACITGQGGGLRPGVDCTCADWDEDLSVDQTDLTKFEECASGPAITADVTCDDPPAP